MNVCDYISHNSLVIKKSSIITDLMALHLKGQVRPTVGLMIWDTVCVSQLIVFDKLRIVSDFTISFGSHEYLHLIQGFFFSKYGVNWIKQSYVDVLFS